MDASIEMKALELEKAIRTHKQLAIYKEILCIDLAKDGRVLVHSVEDFVAYAEHFGEKISVKEISYFDDTDTYTRAYFYHSGTELYTFPEAGEMERYFGKGAVAGHE